MNTKLILLQAAKELATYIEMHNALLASQINPTDLSPPEYHDMQTCQELMEIANNLPQWINVDDRLPEKDDAYLILKDTDDIRVWFFMRRDGDIYWDSKHITKNWLLSSDPVTHWMPLPELP